MVPLLCVQPGQGQIDFAVSGIFFPQVQKVRAGLGIMVFRQEGFGQPQAVLPVFAIVRQGRAVVFRSDYGISLLHGTIAASEPGLRERQFSLPMQAHQEVGHGK